jgi:hypothetical protein
MVKKLIHKTWMTYRGCKVVEKKGVAMNRFSKLYKNSANLKAEQKLSMQLSKKQEAVEANGNGTSGIRLTEGVNRGKVLGHNKIERNKL